METSDFMRHGGARLAGDPNLPLKIALFYQEVPAAGKGAALVNRLVEKFGGEFEVETHLWSFDVLRLPDVAKCAAARTAEADVLMVAARPEANIPEQVQDCIEQALAIRGSRSLAIVALVDRMNAVEPHACKYLRQLCRTEDDSFFWTHDLPLDNCQLTPDRVRERAHSSSPVLQGFLDRPLRPLP